MGGAQLGRLWPRDDAERQAAVDAGYDLDRVLTEDDLVRSDNCFFAATGITDGELLRGVHYDSRGASTQSLVMRSKSGTVRLIEAQPKIDKLAHYSSVDFSLRTPAPPLSRHRAGRCSRAHTTARAPGRPPPPAPPRSPGPIDPPPGHPPP